MEHRIVVCNSGFEKFTGTCIKRRSILRVFLIKNTIRLFFIGSVAANYGYTQFLGGISLHLSLELCIIEFCCIYRGNRKNRVETADALFPFDFFNGIPAACRRYFCNILKDIVRIGLVPSVMRVLRNYAYTGNLLLQQTYRENHLTKRTLQNNGELPKYHIANSHEPIIPLRQFNAVQEEIKRRADKHTHSGVKQNTYPFTGMVVCGSCGKHYRRKITKTGPVWICSTFNTMGKAYCLSKQIPENTLISITEEVLGSTDTLYDKITAIRAEKDNTLVFCFKDGSETVKRWQDRSRAESWTEEMKEAARQKALERSKHNG